MITFLNLGKKGNLGNQLFQIASIIGIAESNNQKFSFPSWQFSDYFDFTFEICDTFNFQGLQEKQYTYHKIDIPNGDFNLNGWYQTERYFVNSDIKLIFKFKQDFEEKLLEKYSYLFSKKNILITIRRGDFVNNPIFFQLDYKYYLTALLVHFENLEEYNLIFASDDISYCKKHFSFFENAFFLENLSPIEQLCLGAKFDNYIISNSTFSWWMAWLGEKKSTKIIRPRHAFDGE
ncbi:alpha-1,2-fucosyltransferase [Flavobacterium sp. FlaQc-57]|uniref:alpha-1,2-fucosyltransferase n=1 Tax=Flavobacterium sp. FlaQc-57 TaxID=3374186 RepID=UPI0037566D81